MRRLVPLLLLALLGCKGGREKDAVGTWTSPKGVTYTLDASKRLEVGVRSVKESGSWSIQGDVVTTTIQTVNGKPVAELKKALQRQATALPPSLKKTIDAMGEPEPFLLSADGKTLTRQSGSGPAFVLTKG